MGYVVPAIVEDETWMFGQNYSVVAVVVATKGCAMIDESFESCWAHSFGPWGRAYLGLGPMSPFSICVRLGAFSLVVRLRAFNIILSD